MNSTTQKDLRDSVRRALDKILSDSSTIKLTDCITLDQATDRICAALPSAEEGKETADDYMKAILCIGHWDLHYHRLLRSVRSLLVTRRKLTDAQSAVLTNMLDELAEKAQRTPPAWPKKDASPSPSERAQRAEKAAREYLGEVGPDKSDDEEAKMYHECDVEDLTKVILRHFSSQPGEGK